MGTKGMNTVKRWDEAGSTAVLGRLRHHNADLPKAKGVIAGQASATTMRLRLVQSRQERPMDFGPLFSTPGASEFAVRDSVYPTEIPAAPSLGRITKMHN